MVAYKIRGNYNRNGPLTRNPFYFNVADFHLPKPTLKEEVNNHLVDGYPIIHVDAGRG